MSNLIKFLIIKDNLYKNSYILLYNNYNYISIKYKDVFYYKTSNFLTINNNVNYGNKNFNIINYIESWSNFFLKKIKFKGKGYKITKKNKFLMLNFNHSHLT
jgi:hypothetical protein